MSGEWLRWSATDPGEDPLHLAESYRISVDFVDDHADFDIALIASTHTVRLDPIASSPLR